MAPAVLEHKPIAATIEEQRLLSAVSRVLDQQLIGSQPVALVGPTGDPIPLPPSLRRVLQQAVDALEKGEVVTVVPIEQELTTRQAADLLNVSRQYLVRLLDEGKIPCTRTGAHRRIRVSDLLAYKEQRDAERRRHLDRLTRLSQQLGLYREPR